jgi:hypothetical protein
MARYAFDEVRAALDEYWGLSIYRGGGRQDHAHDGRWAVEYSRTGYVVHGRMPGMGFSYRRFDSLAAIVKACDLADAIHKQRDKRASRG